MIIVGGSFEVDPTQRDAFVAGRIEMMRASRAEAGCLEYTFAADPVEPDRVILFERWESQETLDAHLVGLRRQPPASAAEVIPTSATIKLYDATNERGL